MQGGEAAKRRHAVLAVLLMAIGNGRAQDEEPRPAARPTCGLMQRLGDAYRSIDEALERGAHPVARAHARRLHDLCRGIQGTAAAEEPDLSADVQEYAERLGLGTKTLMELDDGEPTAVFRETLAGVTQACVSCHLQADVARVGMPALPVGNTLFGRLTVDRADGGQRADRGDLVVFLARVPGDWGPPRRHPVLSQRQRRFDPQVLVVVQGTTVDFRNDDDVYHSVFSRSKGNSFDLGLDPSGTTESVLFDSTGVVQVHCNIYPEMVAHIVVTGNPFAAVTTPSGFFAIGGIPDGKYAIRVWNELGGDVAETLELRGNVPHRRSLHARETRRRLPAAARPPARPESGPPR